jgi:hypothetical protein
VLIPSLSSPAELQALALAGLRSGFLWDRDVDAFVDNDLPSPANCRRVRSGLVAA